MAKDHTVPRFYLNLFAATSTKEVFVRFKGEATRRKPKSTKSLTVEDDAYSVENEDGRDTACDDVNKRFETHTAPLIKSLSANNEPTDDQWRAIWITTSNFLARSRRTRDCVQESLGWAALVVEEMLPVLKENPLPAELVSQFGCTPSQIDALPADLERAAHVLYPLMAAKGTESILLDLRKKRRDLLVVPEGAAFITSDDPALVFVGGAPSMLELRPDFLCQSDVDVFLPLMPNLACLWSDTATGGVIMVEAEEVTSRNEAMWISSYKCVFGCRRAELDALP